MNIGLFTNIFLLHKHQWNTRWAFARKHDIFTCETCYFHMWKDQHCYGYKINHTFCSKKIFKWNDFEFQHLCNKYNITWLLGDTKFPFECWKIFHKWAHFQHSKRNFISPPSQVINYPLQLYICNNNYPKWKDAWWVRKAPAYM